MKRATNFFATVRLSANSLAREFRSSRLRWFFIFVFACFGFTATLSVANIKNALEASIQKQSQAFLGADVAVSSRRDLTDREWATLAKEVGVENVSHLIEVYSMVASSSRSRLMQIRVVDESFPFYGDIQLSSEMNHGQSLINATSEDKHTLLKSAVCWVYPEVLVQLKAKRGDSIKIAGKEFEIAGVVEFDSANTLAGIDLAPRIYIGEDQAESTDLVAAGSTQWHSYLIRKNPAGDAKATKSKIEKALPAKELRIYTHQEAGESAQRLMSYLQDYLSLSSLTVLLLALVSTWFVLKLDLLKAESSLYTQYVLGRSQRSLVAERWMLYLALFFCAYLVSEGLSVVALQSAEPFFRNFTQVQFTYTWTPALLASRLGISLSIATCFLFPLLSSRLNRHADQKQSFGMTQFVSWLPLVFLIAFLVRQFAQSIKLSVAYSIGIVVLYFMFWGLGLVVLKAVQILKSKIQTLPVALKLGLQALVGRKSESLLVFVTLGFSFCFVFTLGHLQKTLLHQIQFGSVAQKPSLFLFDIQDHQLPSLESKLKENNFLFSRVSPLIRARVLSHNGQPQVERTEADQSNKDSEEEAQTRNRGYNLTYRDQLDESETVIEGEYPRSIYQPSQSALPKFSAEEKFSERMGWTLYDVVEFEVLGVPIKAQLTSIRRINWTSFQPNFFVQFQPGVLEEVPKTYIASLAAMTSSEKERAQNMLADQFPNISMIDVASLIQRISDLSNKLAQTLQFMGYLCSVLAVILLLSILSVQTLQNRSDLQLFEQIGLQKQRGQNVFIGQRLFLLILTFCVAVVLSIATAEFLSWKLFSTHSKINTLSLTQVFVSTMVFYFVFELIETYRMYRQGTPNKGA